MEKAISDNTGLPTKTASLTERQEEYLNAYRKEGSISSVAIVLGVANGTAEDNLRFIAKKLGMKKTKELLSGIQEGTAQRKSRVGVRATVDDLLTLIKKQEYRCALSGSVLSANNASCDHIIPVSLGGSDEIDNLQWVDPQINKAKGSMTNEDFIRMCQRVAEWNG
jgi:5-methylcytosine-specific restriction endonuclease McrA